MGKVASGSTAVCGFTRIKWSFALELHIQIPLDRLCGLHIAQYWQAARFTLSNYQRTSSVTTMLETLKWDTLENRRLLAQTTMFYKIINGIVNISIPHRLTPNPSAGRGSYHPCYHQVITNLNSYKYSFYPGIIPLWNILPAAAVTAPSHQAFCTAALPAIRCLSPATSSYGW